VAIKVLSTNPASGAQGVPLHSVVEAVFDKPIDPSSISFGTFFVEGSDKEILSGPYNPMNFPKSTYPNAIADPAYHGIVRGTFECFYQDTNGSDLGTSFLDVVGTAQYRTLIRLKPSLPLSPLHPYKIYLVGTDTGAAKDFGIRSRTVYDPPINLGNTGDGSIIPYGGYTATTTGTFHVEIVQGGEAGDATYKWKLNSGSYSATTLTHHYKKALRDGVTLGFGLQGTFQPGDQFSFLVKPPEYLDKINISEFITGNIGTQAIPTDTSSLISRAAPAPIASLQPGLGLSHTLPINLSCEIDENLQYVDFMFNKPLAPLAIDTNAIRITIGPVNGDTSLRAETSYTPNKIEFPVTLRYPADTVLRVFLENT